VSPQSGYSFTEPNWNLEVFIFKEGGKSGKVPGEKPLNPVRARINKQLYMYMV
jgi:hypothetical protein